LVATIAIHIHRQAYKVTLEPLETMRIGFTTDPKITEGTEPDLKVIASEIVRLCELGYELEKAGLRKEDICRIERHFTIRPQ
jgi:hypothetical protein